MFLKKSTTTIRGKTYNNYKVVESYREGGKDQAPDSFSFGRLNRKAGRAVAPDRFRLCQPGCGGGQK